MKLLSFLSSLALVVGLQVIGTFGFTSPQFNTYISSDGRATSTSLRFGPFSAPKDDGTPGDYVCKVRSHIHVMLSTGISPPCTSTTTFPWLALSLISLIRFDVGLWVCLYQGPQGLGGITSGLLMPTMRCPQTPIQESSKGVGIRKSRSEEELVWLDWTTSCNLCAVGTWKRKTNDGLNMLWNVTAILVWYSLF